MKRFLIVLVVVGVGLVACQPHFIRPSYVVRAEQIVVDHPTFPGPANLAVARAALAQKNNWDENVNWCVSQLLMPKEIVIPYKMGLDTLVLVETVSGSRVVLGRVNDLAAQAENITRGHQLGFCTGNLKCQMITFPTPVVR